MASWNAASPLGAPRKAHLQSPSSTYTKQSLFLVSKPVSTECSASSRLASPTWHSSSRRVLLEDLQNQHRVLTLKIMKKGAKNTLALITRSR